MGLVKIFYLIWSWVGVGHHLAGPTGRPPVLLDPLAVDAEPQHGGHLAEGRANLRGNIVIVVDTEQGLSPRIWCELRKVVEMQPI